MGTNQFIKNDKIKFVLIAQILCICALVVMLFVPREVVNVPSKEFNCENINSDAGKSQIVSNALNLEKGIYRIDFDYKSESDRTNYIEVYADQGGYDSLRTNELMLYENQDTMTYNFALTHSNGTVHIKVNYGGIGEFTVYGATLTQTNIPARIALFWSILIFAVADVVLYLNSKKYFTFERRKILLALIGCFVTVSIPMMLNYVVSGGDLGYHLLRIEGVADALKEGQIPVRLFPKWLFSYGYADAVLYGHTLLLWPAVTRLIGFSNTFSYRMLLALINLLTVVFSYYSFKRAFKDEKGAILATFLYCLMPYRLFALYTAANIGVVSAGVFLPLVFSGLYCIFANDKDCEGYKHNWMLVAGGLAGIMTNHTLSTEITCGFILLICLTNVKKVFKKEIFIELLKAAGGFLALSVYYIVPFIDNYLNYNFHIKNVSARRIQYRGVLPTQFFTLFMKLSQQDFYGTNGLHDATIMTNGIALSLAAVAFVVLLVLYREHVKAKEGRAGVYILLLSLLAAFMCTLYFPWDWLQDRGAVFASLVSSLQFPTRFIIYLGLFLSGLSVIAYKILRGINEKYACGFFCGLMALAVIACCSFSSENSFVQGRLKLYDTVEMGTGYTSGGEYLPQSIYGTDNDVLKYRGPITGEGVEVTSYEKGSLEIKMDVVNSGAEEGYIDVPFLNYIGYKAYDVDTKEVFEISDGDRAEVRVSVPENYTGTIEVKYGAKWYWRIFDVVSLASWCAFIAYAFKVRKAKA